MFKKTFKALSAFVMIVGIIFSVSNFFAKDVRGNLKTEKWNKENMECYSTARDCFHI